MDVSRFENVLGLFRSNDLPDIYALVLFAQSQLETDDFRSNIFLNANNAFGMRPATVRPQERVGIFPTSNGDFALFASTEISFNDRVNLDDWNGVQPPYNVGRVEDYIRKVIVDNNYVPPSERLSYIGNWGRLIAQAIRDYGSQLDPSSLDSVVDEPEDLGWWGRLKLLLGVPYSVVTNSSSGFLNPVAHSVQSGVGSSVSSVGSFFSSAGATVKLLSLAILAVLAVWGFNKLKRML